MNSGEKLMELRASTGMNRREFCEYFEIPYRTVQDWECGKRTMPEYLLRLMNYKIEMEKLQKKKGENGDITYGKTGEQTGNSF